MTQFENPKNQTAEDLEFSPALNDAISRIKDQSSRNALLDCMNVWIWILENDDVSMSCFQLKEEACKKVLGRSPLNECPACEYAISVVPTGEPFCHHCPIDAWRNDDRMPMCEFDGAYGEWQTDRDEKWVKEIILEAAKSLYALNHHP